jgi:hypothetical protein
LGPECKLFLSNLPEEIQNSIRKSCLEFLTTAATDLQDRFPLNDPFFESLKFLKPEIALSLTKPEQLHSLKIVSSKFNSLENINVTAIDIEWKKIAINFSESYVEKQKFLEGSIEDFWHSLKNYKNFQDEYEYRNFAKLAHLCMSLSHSNAETERVFSVVTDVKTKKKKQNRK